MGTTDEQTINAVIPDFGNVKVQLMVTDRGEYSTEVMMGGIVEKAKREEDDGPFVGTFVIREGRDALETSPLDERTQRIATQIMIHLDEFESFDRPNILRDEMTRICG